MPSIIIAGDLFPTDANVQFFAQGNVNTLFGNEICALFSKAELTLCNLEGAFTNHSERCLKTGPIKVAPTSAVEAYKRLGIDYCFLANNHVTDGGHQGLLDTMETLDGAGIGYIGAGKNENSILRSFVQEVGGVKFGFYNVSETMYNKPTANSAGVWLYDEYIVCHELEQLKQECDYLVVIYHGGIEKFPYPSPEIRKRFHRMADNGANLILSQHTHCIGCEEYYNGCYLLYGQGDFLLKNYAPGLTDSGLIIELDIEGGMVEIKKHLVESVDNLFVRYDEVQDLTDFIERSNRVYDEDYVSQQLHLFCDKELQAYLIAFKSPSKLMLRFKRFFPGLFMNWLYHYKKRDLMFALHTLRSEQNRETAIVGIEDMLKRIK